jgi:hypothetical protein
VPAGSPPQAVQTAAARRANVAMRRIVPYEEYGAPATAVARRQAGRRGFRGIALLSLPASGAGGRMGGDRQGTQSLRPASSKGSCRTRRIPTRINLVSPAGRCSLAISVEPPSGLDGPPRQRERPPPGRPTDGRDRQTTDGK